MERRTAHLIPVQHGFTHCQRQFTLCQIESTRDNSSPRTGGAGTFTMAFTARSASPSPRPPISMARLAMTGARSATGGSREALANARPTASAPRASRPSARRQAMTSRSTLAAPPKANTRSRACHPMPRSATLAAPYTTTRSRAATTPELPVSSRVRRVGAESRASPANARGALVLNGKQPRSGAGSSPAVESCSSRSWE